MARAPGAWGGRGRLRAGVAVLALASTSAGGARPAAACDVCAVYTATEQQEARPGPRVGVAEQYSHFGTLRRDGEEVPNPGERIDSSITQLLVGYNFVPRAGVQLNLPIVSRAYRRLEEGRLVSGDESGVGDLALVGHVLAYRTMTERSVFLFTLLGGLKFPTGNPDRLAEELEEDHHEGGGAATFRSRLPRARHSTGGNPDPTDPDHAGAEDESGVHGHDLALGSGSYDGIVGGQLFFSLQRLFFSAGAQYAIRTEGAFDYRYANDLTWLGGPGVYVLLDHRYTLGLQAVVSGETKGKDTQAGETLDDTAITALYAGPGLHFTWGTSLAAEITADLPAIQHNTALQIVPDFRLRGGISWRF